MRVILDTNVLLAALIAPHGPPDAIYRAWRAARFQLLTSTAQLDELRRASRYPKLRPLLPAHRVSAMVNNMQGAIVIDELPPLPRDIEVADPNDAFLVALAIAGDADFLVTGNWRSGLLQRGTLGRTRVMSPAAFCAHLID
jgi:putative PIN family toxin of toxin-antitoxin system